MAQELVEFVKTDCDDDEAGCGLLGNKVWQNFYNCKYGVFTTFVHMPSGYISVTALCSGQGKQFTHWHSLKNSKQTVTDLAEAITRRGDDAVTEHDMLITVKGGSGASRAVVCGTYAHPMLVPIILAWKDSIFAGGLAMMSNNFFGLKNKVSRAEILDLMNSDESAAGNVPADDGDEAVKPPKAKKPKLAEPGMFAIYKRNDVKFPYQAFEGSAKTVKAAIKRFAKVPEGTSDLIYSVCDIAPNVKLFGIIKAAGLIKTSRNSFSSAYEQEQLMDKITMLSWDKIVDKSWCASIQQLREDLRVSDSDSSDSDTE